MPRQSPIRRHALAGLTALALTAALAGCAQDVAPESTFVLLDGSRQTTADMKGKVTLVNFAETRKLPFKVAIDNTGKVAQAWGDVKLTPTTYIVNKQGQIVKKYVGAPNFDELHKLIEKLLAEA